MNGASKILTVSYGTFSCTLEGFDDPFNTMKAIAEYFRDLAADDRYFGAEPPTPDAAMLHRIAEKEIQRRVESKIQDNGVILRAEAAPMPRVTMPSVEARPAPVAAPSVAPAAEAAVESAAARLSRLRAAQTQILKPAPVVASHPDLASRFADLQSYAEDQDAEPAAPVAVADVVTEPALIQIAEPAPEPVAEAAPVAEPAPVADPEPVAPMAQAEAIPAPALAEIPAQAEIITTKPTAVLPPESLEEEAAAEEAPVVMVASAGDLTEAAQDDAPLHIAAAETLVETAEQPQLVAPAEPTPETSDDILASLRETLAGMVGTDDQLTVDIADSASLTTSDIDLSATSAQVDAPELDMAELDMAELELASNPQPEDVLIDVEPTDIDDQELADLMALDNPAETALVETIAVEVTADEIEEERAAPTEIAAEVTPEPAVETATPPEPVEGPAEVTLSQDAPVVAEKLQRARARVIKIRRLDKAPAALAADTLPPVTEAEIVLPDQSDEVPDALNAAPQPELPALTPEAEADLENELAALTAEIGPLAKADPLPDMAPALAELSIEASLDAALAAELPPELPSDLPTVPEPETVDAKIADTKISVPVADDAAVERILAHTNSELEVPETKRRRSAIAHLKAAVMATVAERRINPNANKTDATVKMDPYRQDLNQAVRPTSTPIPERPAQERPAPLVLVSAQRIDRPRDHAADAQRPVPQIVPNPTPAAAPQPVQPVRPRRVTSAGSVTGGSSSLAHAVAPQRVTEAAGDLTADDLDQVFASTEGKQSFTEFAESLGAASLPELMEAAGAYCTLILDTPSFTRPQLFKQMQQMPELADMSREDSLRGFGKLLRDGRIQKSVRGQFVLSEKSPLLHEAKRIAG